MLLLLVLLVVACVLGLLLLWLCARTMDPQQLAIAKVAQYLGIDDGIVIVQGSRIMDPENHRLLRQQKAPGYHTMSRCRHKKKK